MLRVHLARYLVGSQALADKGTHLLVAGWWMTFAAQHQDQALAQFLIGHRKGGGLNDPGHFADARLHFTGGNFFTRPVDQVLGPVGDVEKTLLVQQADVTGVQPAILQGLGTGFGNRQ